MCHNITSGGYMRQFYPAIWFDTGLRLLIYWLQGWSTDYDTKN